MQGSDVLATPDTMTLFVVGLARTDLDHFLADC
jgi:hypothetical protein